MTYTPIQMRRVARQLEQLDMDSEAIMLNQGADAVESLAAKDAEIARLTQALWTTWIIHGSSRLSPVGIRNAPFPATEETT